MCLFIRSIAVIIAITALYVLHDWRALGLLFSDLVRGNFQSENVPWWMNIMALVFYIAQIAKLIASYGLFQLQSWSKNIAIYGLISDFFVRLFGAINLWTYYDRHPELLEVHKKTLESLAKAQQEGVVVYSEVISMWPSYILGIINILLAIIIFLPATRTILKKKNV